MGIKTIILIDILLYICFVALVMCSAVGWSTVLFCFVSCWVSFILCCVCSDRGVFVYHQKFGDLSVRQLERLRCRHRILVLQAHEDTSKENTVGPPSDSCSISLFFHLLHYPPPSLSILTLVSLIGPNKSLKS